MSTAKYKILCRIYFSTPRCSEFQRPLYSPYLDIRDIFADYIRERAQCFAAVRAETLLQNELGIGKVISSLEEQGFNPEVKQQSASSIDLLRALRRREHPTPPYF